MINGGCTAAPNKTEDDYRVFYELFVGSFSDSDGDGCGDIRGIINRMDYLNDGNSVSGKSLGIEGLWLSPIFKSPSYHKYDATDYYTIDPKFGTEEDLKELFALCRERNVKVILDLPLNHTSDSNLMYQKFLNAHKAADSADPYYDFYTNCTKAEQTGGRTYRLISGCTDDYYECNFSDDMPELNIDNEAVREYVLGVGKYYLDLGADGFRFDAIKYIYYGDTPKNVEFWEWYTDELRRYKEDVYLVGECWSEDSETMQYAKAMNCFDFRMTQAEGMIASAAKGGTISVYTNYVEAYLSSLSEINSSAMIIPLISNHDMDRASGYVTVPTKRMYMAANLYILCSGSPFIYYGEEIGMRGTKGAAKTDANRRLAMLWGDGDTVENPVGATYEDKKQTNGTVAEQLSDENSLLNYYSRLIALRNRYPEIPRGEYKSVTFNNSTFGGFLITYKEAVTGLFHNTSDREQLVDLSSVGYSFKEVSDFIGQGDVALNGSILKIGPQTSVILR